MGIKLCHVFSYLRYENTWHKLISIQRIRESFPVAGSTCDRNAFSDSIVVSACREAECATSNACVAAQLDWHRIAQFIVPHLKFSLRSSSPLTPATTPFTFPGPARFGPALFLLVITSTRGMSPTPGTNTITPTIALSLSSLREASTFSSPTTQANVPYPIPSFPGNRRARSCSERSSPPQWDAVRTQPSIAAFSIPRVSLESYGVEIVRGSRKRTDGQFVFWSP
mmetsp:Transcript_29315/g.73606  ORF Transcript_29315/g.73606 Transcript_29315/m.73606 type:complete len:225 (-) Transcript_29315:221-895(-)